MLSQKHLRNVCLMGRRDQKTCRYLYNDDLDYRKWYCSKLHQIKRNKIDVTIRVFIADSKKKGVDPRTKTVPLGDNCPGFPILKHIIQGET